MQLDKVNHEMLQKMIAQLDQSLYNHQQWYNSLIRTLICKLAPDQHDINPESYKECRFGQWYYSEALKDLIDHPGFKALGEEHMKMHQQTSKLLSTIHTGVTISVYDYDNFANILERMRLEIFALKRELENLLYNRDPLTGAINRISMLPILREQQEISKRENQPYCVVMMDLDHFKEVNDAHGHAAGDTTLSSVVKCVTQYLRPYDKVFRYGGEEFLLCLHNVSLESAYEFIEGLRKGLTSLDIVVDSKSFRITASFGINLLDPYASVEQSIDRADKAVLAAKASGGNCTKIWKQEATAA